MTTHADGAAPSVAPGPEGGRGDPAASASDGEDAEDAVGGLEAGPLWLREEIQRRIAANRALPRARHARHDGGERAAAVGYVPRHSDRTPGPGAPPPRPSAAAPVAPTARPTPQPRRPVAPPAPGPMPPSPPAARPVRPAPDRNPAGPPTAPVFDVPGRAPEIAVPEPRTPASDAAGARVRVVFSERRNPTLPVGTKKEVQEGTAIGDLLRTELIGSQLAVALRFAAVAGLSIGLLPLLFVLFPAVGQAEVLGMRLPWLLLGVLVYPFLLALGWWHTRTAERVEQSFADHVED